MKLIYIDPPFNTGQAFDNYDDNLEHSILASDDVPKTRTASSTPELLAHWKLNIDDNEMAYATVILDEIFGRKNRCYIVSFKQGAATGHKSINPGLVTTSNFVLIYAKNKQTHWKPAKGFVEKAAR